MKAWIARVLGVGFVVALGMTLSCTSKEELAGPYGGDIVPLQDGKVNAEILSNADTGEVMVHTWGQDLKTPEPIKAEPLSVGSEERSMQLMPHPVEGDPPGFCSRFYGQGDWVRGGGIHHGWLRRSSAEGLRHSFAWKNCWRGGRDHGSMWGAMRQHGQHGMHGGPGPHR